MKLRTCPGCGKKYHSGKRALVDGAIQRVCRTCAANALRVVSTVAHTKCSDPACNETATICPSCHAAHVRIALDVPLSPVAAALRAMGRALSLVEAKEAGAEDYLRGKVEGLESAIELVGKASGATR